MSVVRGLYTVVSDKCFRPSSIYWVLSRTTIVEPLSALLITMSVLSIRFDSATRSLLVRLSEGDCVCWSSTMFSFSCSIVFSRWR